MDSTFSGRLGGGSVKQALSHAGCVTGWGGRGCIRGEHAIPKG